MIILALLAVNIILALICVFKKGSEEEEFRVKRGSFTGVATTMAPMAPTMAPTRAPFIRR
jgi:hypothetical protein